MESTEHMKSTAFLNLPLSYFGKELCGMRKRWCCKPRFYPAFKFIMSRCVLLRTLAEETS